MSPAPVPPRFVPTLTEVVTLGSMAASVPPETAHLKTPLASGDEHLMERIMQRLDMVLERRLRETLGQLVLAQTQAWLPDLRKELQGMVREAVQQAREEHSPDPKPDRR